MTRSTSNVLQASVLDNSEPLEMRNEVGAWASFVYEISARAVDKFARQLMAAS